MSIALRRPAPPAAPDWLARLYLEFDGGCGARGSAIRILMVEDDAAIAAMYSLQLRRDGYLVRVATDGATGLEMLRSERPDLVLLDVRLPELDGFDILEAARRDAALRQVPVVLLSNYGADDMRERGAALGAIDYVVKSQAMPAWLSAQIPNWIKQAGKD